MLAYRKMALLVVSRDWCVGIKILAAPPTSRETQNEVAKRAVLMN